MATYGTLNEIDSMANVSGLHGSFAEGMSKEDVQKYLDDQADSFQDYVPEETKRIGNAVLEQKNQYVVLCVSGDSDQAKEIIEKAFK